MRVCRVTVLAFCGEDGFEQKWETGGDATKHGSGRALGGYCH